MGTISEGTHERAAAEATRWLIALQDTPDDAEMRARFDSWLDADSVNAAAWAEVSHVYDMIGETEPLHAWRAPLSVRPMREHIAARPSARRWSLRYALSGIAATVAVACVGVFVLVPDLALRLQADHITAIAEQRAVALDDGSKVQLAPDSAVDIVFAGDERRVRLLKGEAFFDVAPDPDRPFRVESDGIETTVLGTGFDVRMGERGTEIGVQHGTVRVDDTTSKSPVSERLEPGDWISLRKGGQIERGSSPPEQIASWMRGQIIAKDRLVADVVDDLRRYYRGTIVLTGSLGARRLTGVYNLSDPVAALEAVARTHGATVRQVSPSVMVVSD